MSAEKTISVKGRNYTIIGKGSIESNNAPKKLKCDYSGCGKEFVLRENYKKSNHEFTNTEGTKYFHNRECKEAYIAELQKSSEDEDENEYKQEICPDCGCKVRIKVGNEQRSWNMHHGKWCVVKNQKPKQAEKKKDKIVASEPKCQSQQETSSISILNNNIFEFLESAPIEYIDAFESEKLKQLIIKERSK